jgi:hypothetical protein
VVANPSQLTLGNSTNLTARVTGGAGWIGYDWTATPVGCASRNASFIDCTPSETGTFVVTVVVNDSVGKSATNSTDVVVNASETSSTGSGSTLSPMGVYLFALVLGIVAAVVASVIVAVFLRRRSRRPPGPPLPVRPYVPPKQEQD